MKLIPVIDLMNGIVVRAIKGQRQSYLPSSTPLCQSSQPEAVISALLGLYPFDTLYIADLDAITGRGSNIGIIGELSSMFQETLFWVDNGVQELQQLQTFARPVIGTESLRSIEQLAHLVTSLPSPVLSLDYVDNRYRGPQGLLDQPELWPDEVILMSLSHVGSAAGADTARLQQLTPLLTTHNLYAAGGIRDLQDLYQLQGLGLSGALLSTALHQGSIDSQALSGFMADTFNPSICR
ncbi:MAG: HisA/HisF-related TIM barrel protein [Candidatus Thiodiazotropha taylori]|nr:HisA/HisF-related TIM barrel protein [Candidatus Thiodiazotropha taylori]MCW4243035.1 HisA/HisF-related TIM barrel protein [Candidatus Thiodiazotropha taylori]